MAILRWLVTAIIGPLLDGLAGILRDKQANADAKARGRFEQLAEDQRAAIEAMRRLQEAQNQPSGREATEKALREGKF